MIFLQIISFGSDLILSLIVAYFLCILFEMPTRTLEKLLFRQTALHQKSKKEVTNKEDLNNPTRNPTELSNGETTSTKYQDSTKKVL